MVFIFQEHWSVRQKRIPVLTFDFFSTHNYWIFISRIVCSNALLNDLSYDQSSTERDRPRLVDLDRDSYDNFHIMSMRDHNLFIARAFLKAIFIRNLFNWEILNKCVCTFLSLNFENLNFKNAWKVCILKFTKFKISLNHAVIVFCTIICCITPWSIWIVVWISAIIIVVFLT